MKKLFLALLFINFGGFLLAQTSVKTVSKPPLDFSILGKWPSVNNPKISNDGKYVIYTNKEDERQTLIIKSTETAWEKQIRGASSNNSVFTENSRYVITKIKDSLLIIKLSSGDCEVITGVVS
jgi:hypothetical protein